MLLLSQDIRMKKFTKIIIGIIILLLLAVLGTAVGTYYIPNKLSKEATIETVIVDEDQTGAEIGEMLYEKGLIRSELAFRIALRANNVMDKLQRGYYQIPDNISMHELILLLQQGHLKTVRVTVPEGYTLQEIAALLEKNQLVKSQEFLAVAKDYVPYQYMYGPRRAEYRVEGFLFPSTYDIPVNSTPKEILDLMAKEMNDQLTSDVRKAIMKDHMTIYEFITLSSLVEREALFDEDRPTIAAIFKHRLAVGMPLQSDASISYILGYPKEHITLEDTKLESPYNTYIHKGFPPGPIANPGKKSMEAVLYAPPTEYLYFVADKEGHNHFSKTYEEHLKVVESIYGN